MNISVSSCFNFVSGYSTLLSVILEGLPNKSFCIKPKTYSSISTEFDKFFENIPSFKEDLDLFLCPPYSESGVMTTHPLFHMRPHKNRIIFTMWEATRVSDFFIEHLNSCTSIIVPNEWNKKNFINQGCEVPIEVLPLFVDDYFSPIELQKSNDKFVFGCSNGDIRKNLNRIVSTFSKAFGRQDKNVLLRVKFGKHDASIRNILSNNIEVVRCDFSKQELNRWYCNNNVYVSGVSAEGWGFMQIESLACGVPVLGQRYASLPMYLDDSNNINVKFSEIPSIDHWKNPGAKWSSYDEDDMIDKMRWCYNNPSKINEMKLDCISVKKKFSKEIFLDGLANILNKYSQSV